MTVRAASCPSCGAPIEFRNAATLLVVCASCGGASRRTDVKLELLGKVAEVAPIDSLLDLGTTGAIEGKGWTAVGQVQLDHGRGPWNEWCLLFDDGTWGWLAEAQGEVLFTRSVPRLPVPPHDRLRPGDPADLGAAGSFVVAEVGKATVTAVRGEIPVPIRPGEPRLYADLRSGEKGFATLDYGDDRTCDAIFVGRAVAPSEAGLDPSKAPAAATRAAPAERLKCPKCGGELRIRDPEGALRVGCTHCGSLLDPRDPGAAVLGATKWKCAPPLLPLGAKGRLRGLEVEVIAFLVRSVTFAGMRYPWREYLLKAARGKGYRWLAESKKHWLFLEPVSVGEVKVHRGVSAECRDVKYKHFQGGTAVVDAVYGEVYWRVEIGEEVQSDDYVAPPLSLTVETDGKEVNPTLGAYLPPEELAEAFALKNPLPVPEGVAPSQPNPHRPGIWWALCGGAAAADLLFSVLFSSTGREEFGFPCCLTLPVLLGPAVLASTRSGTFETERWAESDHPRWGGGDGEGDDE